MYKHPNYSTSMSGKAGTTSVIYMYSVHPTYVYIYMYIHWTTEVYNQRQNNRDQSHFYHASYSLGNVVLAHPSTFVRCVLLLPSSVKTYLQGLYFLRF